MHLQAPTNAQELSGQIHTYNKEGKEKKEMTAVRSSPYEEFLFTADKSPIVWSYQSADFRTLIQTTFLHFTAVNASLEALSWKWCSPPPA